MKNLLSFIAFILLFCTPPSLAQTSATKQGIINACMETVQNYAVYRDQLDAEGYTSVFTETGTFLFGEKTFNGRTELRSYINNQPEDIQTLHHITTKQINVIDDHKARGIIYAQVYFSKISTEPGSVYREAHVIYTDSYKLNNGICEIEHRSLKILTDDQVSK